VTRIPCSYAAPMSRMSAGAVPADHLALLQLANSIAVYLGILLEDCISVGGLLGQACTVVALQPDDVSSNGFENISFNSQVGIVVVTYINFKVSQRLNPSMLSAKIRSLYSWIVTQCLSRLTENYSTILDDITTVSDLESHKSILFDDQDGHSQFVY